MAELAVDLHGHRIGTLTGSAGAFDFQADPHAVRQFGLGSTLLSLAVPLVPRANRAGLRIRRTFFAELLAEGDARARLASEAKVRPDDTMGMLRAYGRDVAGALQIWDPADPAEPRTPAVEPVDDLGVERLLLDVQNSPLGNKPKRGKTSLNGVQGKIVLVRTEAGWARALDGFPSTHILKPIVGRLPSMIFDEEYGSRFARGLGLADFDTHLERFGDTSAIVIARYDRDPASPDGRIHQEDFSQVLGLSGDDKYEVYGNKGLSDIAARLQADDRLRLLRMAVLSVAVGNLDMHTKNISLLHHRDGSVALAPMYDVVPQTHFDNDGEMAVGVGGVFSHRLITRENLVEEGTQWGVPNAAAIVDDALSRLREIAGSERPHPAAHPGLQHLVLRFTDNLRAGRATADDGDGSFDPAAFGAAGGGGWENPAAPGRRL